MFKQIFYETNYDSVCIFKQQIEKYESHFKNNWHVCIIFFVLIIIFKNTLQ